MKRVVTALLSLLVLLAVLIPIVAHAAIAVGDSGRAPVRASSSVECAGHAGGGSQTIGNGEGGHAMAVLGDCVWSSSKCSCNIHIQGLPYGGIPKSIGDYTWNVID